MRLSWLVRVQVGAKMGKLTRLGGLRGNKLELKWALGAPKEAPGDPKSATTDIDPGAKCLISEPWGPPTVT